MSFNKRNTNTILGYDQLPGQQIQKRILTSDYIGQGSGSYWYQYSDYSLTPINSGSILAVSGTADDPSLSFRGNTNSGFFLADTNKIGISTGGTERVRIDDSGNVGIGIEPSVKFHVAGAGADGGAGVFQSTDNYNTLKIIGGGGATFFQQSPIANSPAYYDNQGDSYTYFRVNEAATTAMTISSSGDVGIGTATPGYLLHVKKTGDCVATIEGSTAAFLRTYDSGGGSDEKYVDILNNGGIFTVRSLNDDFSVKNTILTTDVSGQVAIGNTSPVKKLTVSGSIAAINGTTSAPSITFMENTGSGLSTPFSNFLGFITDHTTRWAITSTGHLSVQGVYQLLVDDESSDATAPGLSFYGDQNSGVFCAGVDEVGISTDGKERFRIDASGDSMVSGSLVVSGSFIAPEMQHYVCAVLTSSNGSQTEFNPFDTVSNGGDVVTITNNGIAYSINSGTFTVSNAGIYKIDVTAYMQHNVAGNVNVDFFKIRKNNTTDLWRSSPNMYDATDIESFSANLVVSLSADDYIEVKADSYSTNYLYFHSGTCITMFRIA
jgi:hypothetical protein